MEAGIAGLPLLRVWAQSATFYKRRAMYGGMDRWMARKKEFEEENRRLKLMDAQERMNTTIVAKALANKWTLTRLSRRREMTKRASGSVQDVS